ncbi:hypothetical protein BSKO_07644 [Bryopsis sp. KO-2023]|nr:hypothetical protein BSKO_07644 [Bryopsis sp. KO-2023]
MVYLFGSRKRGFGVWDGKYEYLLDKETLSVSKQPRTEPPRRAAEGEIEFEDKAFYRYVTLENRIEESRYTGRWLRIILECARLLDVLTDALVKQAGVSRVPAENLTWRKYPAKFLYKEYCGEKQLLEGEVLCWSDREKHLMIFGGFKYEARGSQRLEVWYGNPPVSVLALNRQDAPEICGEESRSLTWEEAMEQYSAWLQNAVTLSPLRDATPVATMLLEHRRERFIKALCWAQSKCGGNSDGWEAGASKQQIDAVQIIADLQAELEPLMQGKESLRGVGETNEQRLSRACRKMEDLRGVVGMIQQENEDLKRKTLTRDTTKKDLLGAVGNSVDIQTELSNLKETNELLKCEVKKSEELKGMVAILQQENENLRRSLENGAGRIENKIDSKSRSGGGNFPDEMHSKLNGQSSADGELLIAQQQGKTDIPHAFLGGGALQQAIHRSEETAGESGLNIGASSEDIPFLFSVAAAGGDMHVSLTRNLYFQHGRTDAGAQNRFGKAIARLLRGMYVLTHERYVQQFDSMLKALMGIESLSSITMYSMEAFKLYCRRRWKELCSHINASRDSQGASAAKRQVPKLKSVGWTPYKETEPQKTPLESLQKLFDDFFGSFPSSTLDQRKSVFDELWKMTVSMFVHRPHRRFAFTRSIWGPFDRLQHEHVDSSIKEGQRCVELIPPVLEAPHDSLIPTASGGWDSGLEWVQVAKAHVDAPAS